MRVRNIEDARSKWGARGAALVEKAMGGGAASVAPRKFRNEPTVVEGERFDSRLEARVFERLVAAHGRKNVIRQVSIPIGAKRIRPDFLVILERFEDGSFWGQLLDAKGHETEGWSAKANHLASAHALPIGLVKR